jgi:hypothetical protein
LVAVRNGLRQLRPQTTPGFELVTVREHSVLLLVLTAVNRQAFAGFPAADRAFATVEVRGDLLPGLERLLWRVPLRPRTTISGAAIAAV